MNDQSTALSAAKQGGLTAFTAVNNPFKKTAKQEGVTDGFWLRMNGKSGAWLTNLPGVTELEQGTELVFNMFSAKKLWQGFDGQNKLHRGPEVTIISGKELPDPPPTAGVKWTKTVTVMTSTTDGTKQMLLSAKADNPYRPILKLIDRFGDLFVKFPDPGSKAGYKMPIIEIKSAQYDMDVKKKEVVKDPVTKEERLEEVTTKTTNAREVFTITDNEDDWVSEKQMRDQMEAAGLVVAAPVAPEVVEEESPFVEDAPKLASAPIDTVSVPNQSQTGGATTAGKPLEGQIIPPTPAPGSFRRNRAGNVPGVRTA